MAKARGWKHVTVNGTDEFRKAAWIEASLSGLKVAGYNPTAHDQEDLARHPSPTLSPKLPNAPLLRAGAEAKRPTLKQTGTHGSVVPPAALRLRDSALEKKAAASRKDTN
jgi:hypothetical protein